MSVGLPGLLSGAGRLAVRQGTQSSALTRASGQKSATLLRVRKMLFILNHVCMNVFYQKFVLAFTLHFGALFGHGSREAVWQDQVGFRVALFTGLAGNFLGSRVFPYQTHPERAYFANGAFGVMAAALLLRLSQSRGQSGEVGEGAREKAG